MACSNFCFLSNSLARPDKGCAEIIGLGAEFKGADLEAETTGPFEAIDLGAETMLTFAPIDLGDSAFRRRREDVGCEKMTRLEGCGPPPLKVFGDFPKMRRADASSST